MPEKPPKRPRDLNQWAKHIADIAAGEADDSITANEDTGKSAAAVKRGRAGGLKGGKARADTMSAEKRTEIARKAAAKRWNH